MKNILLILALAILLLPGCKREDPAAEVAQYEPSADAIAVTPLDPIDPDQARRIASGDGPTWKKDITTEAMQMNTPPAEAPIAPTAAPTEAAPGAPAPRLGDPNGF